MHQKERRLGARNTEPPKGSPELCPPSTTLRILQSYIFGQSDRRRRT